VQFTVIVIIKLCIVMDTSSWRLRVLLEPRGFIRVLEVILAIVAFATTGGYSGQATYSIACKPLANASQHFTTPISYPFRLSSTVITIEKPCNKTTLNYRMEGDLSPSAQWFEFVGVTAFLYALGSVVFYVVFDAVIRQTHERLVTIGDLAGTVLYAFFWLTAASAWAWGLGQVKIWSGHEKVLGSAEFKDLCQSATCRLNSGADYSPLTASVAFGFLNFFLWLCNIWFVYKESPYHQEPDKQMDPSPQPPNTM